MRARNIAILVVSLVVVMAVWHFIRPNPNVTPASNYSECRNNLKQISLALNLYHDDFGTFPPAYVEDDSGTAMHSWRVLILPYMDQRELYERYRFDEAWNGPHNSELAELMPQPFRCPSYAEATGGQEDRTRTNYQVVIGDDSILNGTGLAGRDDITDGPGNTVLVIESAVRPVHWMSPLDRTADDAWDELEASQCSHHRGLVTACADASITTITLGITKAVFLGMVTKSGGEPAVPHTR